MFSIPIDGFFAKGSPPVMSKCAWCSIGRYGLVPAIRCSLIEGRVWTLRTRTPDDAAACRTLRSTFWFMSRAIALSNERPVVKVRPLYFILIIAQPFGG